MASDGAFLHRRPSRPVLAVFAVTGPLRDAFALLERRHINPEEHRLAVRFRRHVADVALMAKYVHDGPPFKARLLNVAQNFPPSAMLALAVICAVRIRRRANV